MATLGADLELGDIKAHRGILYACGWHAEEILFCTSSLTTTERELLDGTNYTLVVCAATGDAVRSTVEIAEDGEVIVGVESATGTSYYGCRNYADGFSLKA